MALATTIPFSKTKVLLGNGATPEVFATPCGLTGDSVNFSKATNSTVTPDCDDPDAAGWEERDAVSQSATIAGNGVMATESVATWWAAYNRADTVNARFFLDAPGGGHWDGAFHVTRFEVGGSRGNRSTVTIEMLSDGAVVFTPTP
jgi:predicted secreted protein